MSQDQDTGLIKRGLFLLALMSTLVVVVCMIIFQRPTTALPVTEQRPELTASSLVRFDTAFPGSISWATIGQLNDAFPSGEGWNIRYNAAAALAGRGSDKVPWPIILEMLDENRQMRNFRAQLQDGTVVPDEASARITVVAALKATAEWHKMQASHPKEVSPDLVQVYAAVDKLAASPIMEVKMQAENTRKLFFR